jgi:hypothetical protein
MEKDQAFLEYVVKALVTKPDAVKINRKVDEMGVLLTMQIDQEDMGRIIGREGNTAKAIRTLLKVVGRANQAVVNLKIEEPEGGRKPPRLPTEQVAKEESIDDVMEDLKI